MCITQTHACVHHTNTRMNTRYVHTPLVYAHAPKKKKLRNIPLCTHFTRLHTPFQTHILRTLSKTHTLQNTTLCTYSKIKTLKHTYSTHTPQNTHCTHTPYTHAVHTRRTHTPYTHNNYPQRRCNNIIVYNTLYTHDVHTYSMKRGISLYAHTPSHMSYSHT